jgi:serine/threonine protein phosphatase PrpC
MFCDVWVQTNIGLKRQVNQDSFLVNKDLGLYIVADGMGGHSGGEVASAMAVNCIQDYIKNNPELSPRELLDGAYIDANHQIHDKAQKNPELHGMGTTMVLGLVKGSKFYIGNVGDSRCYLFQENSLWQITEDHSLMNEQLRAGIINDEQAKNYAHKNVITRSVGYESSVNCDILEREIQDGDVFLFCSDGLSGMVTDKIINQQLKELAPEKWVDKLIELSLARGGSDNVTALILHFYSKN